MEILDIGLYVAYGLLIFAALAAIILPLVSSLSNPKSLIKSGIGIAVVAVIFIISYVIADSEVTAASMDISEGTSKFVGGALITMYVLFFIALVGIIITELNKAVK